MWEKVRSWVELVAYLAAILSPLIAIAIYKGWF